MAVDIVLDALVIDIDAADAHDALGRIAEAVAEAREGGADAGVERADLHVLDLGLLGERERVTRVGERHEGIRLGRDRRRDDRRDVLGAQRIGALIDDLEAGFLEGGLACAHQFQAEGIGNVHQCHAIADLAGLAHALERADHAHRQLARGAQQPEGVRPTLDEFRHAVGRRRSGDVRVVVLGDHRRGGDVDARRVRRDDEVDLVLGS